MDTGSARKSADDADTFEAFADGDFKVNLQRLSRCITEHEPSAGPFSDGADTIDPRAAIFNLALDHLARHDIGTSPLASRCPLDDRACKALGAAQVVLRLGWASADERVAAPALALHEAFATADRALAALGRALAAYNDTRHAHHQLAAESPPKVVPCTVLGHAHYCEPPARLAPAIERWRASLAFVDDVALVPQLPAHVASGERRGLLAAVEAALDDHGWSLDEITAVIDDQRGGDPRTRKDRLRHRLGEVRARRAAT